MPFGAARLLGFAAVTLVAVVLVSYLANVVFFHLSSSWVAPVTLSSTDERVVTARSQLLAHKDQRDRTAAELAQAERSITSHQAFQSDFAGAAEVANGERGDGASSGVSYEALRIKREYEASRLELAKALADRELLATSLDRQESTIADLEKSAYLRALSEDAMIALVPYTNMADVKTYAPVYACRLGFVGCRKVGSVREVLHGEVTFQHPRRDEALRGQMVELQLTDPNAIKQDVLFVGGKPLGL